METFEFHELTARTAVKQFSGSWGRVVTEFTYTFENFFHPFVGELIQQANRKSLPGLLDPDFHERLTDPKFFDTFYTALTSDLVKVNHFPKEIDLRESGPYANYNWELFFHVPLTIAVHLSKNQRYAEAQRWFHYIFDPTSNDTSVPVPQRFWKFLAFRKAGEVKQIDEQLGILSKPANECSATELKLKEKILEGYEAIKNKPFQPHAVARTRQLAYQYCVVMKYMDNLIAWGDSLFRQDTIESINEATQLYVLAANLLGQRPQRIPQSGTVRPKTFADLKKRGLDAMGNALVDLEGKFPLNLGLPKTNGTDPDAAGQLFGIGRTLYFCIPRNEKMLGYWDTVADRLFKIRHCRNIEGMVRQLALFEPPIDPGMLVKAAAAGIDISSVVNGLNQPVSPVRSLYLIQKALELCAEVRSLGGALLATIEKGDSERLAVLRQSHEVKIQQMQQEVRFLHWASAQESIKSLLTSRKPALERLHYYQRLLNFSADPNAPDTLPLDFNTLKLNETNFAEAYTALVGQYDKDLKRPPHDSVKHADAESPLNIADLLSSGRLYLTDKESLALNVLPPLAAVLRFGSASADLIASALSVLPSAKVKASPFSVGAEVEIPIGQIFSNVGGAVARSIGSAATLLDNASSFMQQTASYERRADEWLLQHNLAAWELMQVGRQILTSLIAEQIAHHEYQTIKQQIANAKEVDQFLHSKFTNEDLHLWMQGEISRLYYEYYRFAFDTARKAEKSMKQELMRPEVDAQDFVKFNYWDGGRKGLLSGEALYLDVKRMEMAYHDNNKRELELTKHVSLRQLNPVALLALKTKGTCTFTVPEWLYDLDCPGHYMRRIKIVSISIPAVVGPYSGVSCTASLLKSSLRKSSSLKDNEYTRQGSEDDRFIDYFSAAQSIVTSTGQNDSGMFEANLRDERFLPFEGAGAESTWKLDLPKDYRAFDYETIADVILHIRYTARQGVDSTKVKPALDNLFQQANQSNLTLLFSLRHDFPTEWAKFVTGTHDFTTTIHKDHFPYFTRATQKQVTITGFELYGKDATKDVSKHHVVGDQAAWDVATDDLGDKNKQKFVVTVAPDGPGPTQVLTRTADTEVYLVVRYSLS